MKLYSKGQLNSEWIYEVIVSPEIPPKNYRDFCPGSLLEGRADIFVIFDWYSGRNNDLIKVDSEFNWPLVSKRVAISVYSASFCKYLSKHFTAIIKQWMLIAPHAAFDFRHTLHNGTKVFLKLQCFFLWYCVLTRNLTYLIRLLL